jgi:hypothetical protein
MTARKKVSARGWIEQYCRPGNARDFITHDGIRPGDRVVLCCRVSTRQQDHTGNLTAHERHLRAEIAARRANVVGVVRHVGSGFDPLWVGRAAYIAKRHNAKIVAIATDRLIRHPDYKSTGTRYERNARACTEDLEDLNRYADGVELVTLTDPDATLADCMAVHKKIGQHAKGRKGGRPGKNPPGYKKERRLRNQSQVFWMRAVGYPVRQIARILDQPESTVRRWVRRFFR